MRRTIHSLLHGLASSDRGAPQWRRWIPVMAAVLALGGCATSRAPAMPVFGAYFPAWLVAALFGLVVAILGKVLIVMAGFEAVMPWQLGVCASIGLIGAVAFSILIYG